MGLREDYEKYVGTHGTTRGFRGVGGNSGKKLVRVRAKFREGIPRHESVVVNHLGEVTHTTYIYHGEQGAFRSNVCDADGKEIKAPDREMGATVEFDIEESRLPILESKTMNDELRSIRETARRAHIANMRRAVAENPLFMNGRRKPQTQGNDVARWGVAEQSVLTTYTGSVEAEVARLGGRLPPFESFEIVEDAGLAQNLDEGVRLAEAERHKDAQAAAIAAAVAGEVAKVLAQLGVSDKVKK